MSSQIFKFAVLLLIGGAAACSDSGTAVKADAYVTNAEYVLEQINTANASGVAFQVKPIRQTACEHMYIEIGNKNAEGQWSTTHVLYPGQDERNNFGQFNLENQIHFADVDAAGEYGVLGLGCKPHDQPPNIIKGLLTTFEVEQGKLNYIGEIALVPTGSGFVKTDVADRSEFALKQIQSQLPTLETHFTSNIMKAPKVDLGLSPEDMAKLDEISKIKR